MTTTRSDIETLLVSRLSGWLTSAGMAVTIVGSNASLNDPIGWAIRQVGGSVVSPALVTTTDVQTVVAADLDKLIDLAELRTLEAILANFSAVDKKAGPVEIKSSQFADRILALLALKRAWLNTTYGIGDYGAFSIGLTRVDGYSELV
jgi:hypothetical protein